MRWGETKKFGEGGGASFQQHRKKRDPEESRTLEATDMLGRLAYRLSSGRKTAKGERLRIARAAAALREGGGK